MTRFLLFVRMGWLAAGMGTALVLPAIVVGGKVFIAGIPMSTAGMQFLLATLGVSLEATRYAWLRRYRFKSPV